MDPVHVELFMAIFTVLTTLAGMVGIVWKLRGDIEKRFTGEARSIEKQLTEIEGKIAMSNQWHALHEAEDARRFNEVQRQLDDIREIINRHNGNRWKIGG